MLEKILDFQKTSMFLTDTSEDIDAHFRYIASKKTSHVFSKWTLLNSAVIVHKLNCMVCKSMNATLPFVI